MKSILLIGLGRFGKNIAVKLNELKHDVMAIDENEERVKEALPYLTNAQIGDSTNEDFLRTIGINDYDVCIVAIGKDFQSSLETTSLLKDLGAKMVVSRASSDVHAKFLLRNGADKIVYPEKNQAIWTAICYSSNHIFDYIELDEEHTIFEVEVPQTWVNRTIGEINIRQKYNITIIALKREGKVHLTITPETCFSSHDSLLVLGKNKDLHKYFHI